MIYRFRHIEIKNNSFWLYIYYISYIQFITYIYKINNVIHVFNIYKLTNIIKIYKKSCNSHRKVCNLDA